MAVGAQTRMLEKRAGKKAKASKRNSVRRLRMIKKKKKNMQKTHAETGEKEEATEKLTLLRDRFLLINSIMSNPVDF